MWPKSKVIGGHMLGTCFLPMSPSSYPQSSFHQRVTRKDHPGIETC
jgi:hypothetical protein